MASGEKEKDRSPLTRREAEILNFMAQGFLNKQIANEIGISAQTIKNYVTSILRKLNAGARTETVVIALKQGYIELGNIEVAGVEEIWDLVTIPPLLDFPLGRPFVQQVVESAAL